MAADASLIEADANKQNSTPKEDWDHSAIDPRDAPLASISPSWTMRHSAQHQRSKQIISGDVLKYLCGSRFVIRRR